MKKVLKYLVLLAIALVVGCSTETQPRGSAGNLEAPAPAAAPAPANPANNQQDQNQGAAADPVDQGETRDDLAIPQKIRRDILDDNLLSTNAKNVKIITERSSVTLRGVVDSRAEKRKVEKIARQVAGVKKVDNQLEVMAS